MTYVGWHFKDVAQNGKEQIKLRHVPSVCEAVRGCDVARWGSGDTRALPLDNPPVCRLTWASFLMEQVVPRKNLVSVKPPIESQKGVNSVIRDMTYSPSGSAKTNILPPFER